MNETIHHKFRSMTDVNQFVFRYWALMKGEFAPLNMNRIGKNFSVGEDNRTLYQAIEQQKYKTICINDTCTQEQYEKAKEAALRHLAIFGEGNYYLEMQDHGIADQRLSGHLNRYCRRNRSLRNRKEETHEQCQKELYL